MREAFISILAVFAIVAPSANCSDKGKDGFNFYKDYLRGRTDETEVLAEEVASGDRILYFYRTPLHIPSLLPVHDQEYRKRTGNGFKNHMLSKELRADEQAPRKRSSKTALSLMLQSKQPYYAVEDSLGDNMELPLK